MEISAGILHEELGKMYDIQALGDISYELALENVMFLRAGRTPDPGRVWIADKDAKHTAKTLAANVGKKNQRIRAVVVMKDPEALRPLAEIFESAFLINGKCSTSKMHSAIQDIFSKYDYWDAELHRVLTSSSDIESLINVGTRIFGNPLILHDVNFKTVAVSSEYAGEPALTPLLDNEKLPFLMQSERSNAVPGTVSGNVRRLRANGMPGISVNLFRRGKFKYSLILIELVHDVGPHEGALLEYLSDYVRLVLGLVTGGSSVALSIAGFMANVLSGEITSHEYIAEQMAGFGWRRGDKFVIYRVFTNLHEKDDRTLGFITTRIADLFDEQCVFEHDDSIVVAFDLTSRGGSDVPVDIAMAEFLRDNNLTAGKSDVFTGVGHIVEYYEQAGIANKLRPKVKQYDHLCRFRDVVKQHLLESCTERLPAFMVCAPELLRLKAYDEEHRTEFYHTLSVFLKNDLHSVKAAKDLFVARSTFIYRIERIQAITGLDLGKRSDRWYLLLSLKLIEQADKQEAR
jgi:hypothetical protein